MDNDTNSVIPSAFLATNPFASELPQLMNKNLFPNLFVGCFAATSDGSDGRNFRK